MTRPSVAPLVGLAVWIFSPLAGCGTEGVTPDCSGYPSPYDIRVPRARDRALDSVTHLASPPYSCLTLPDGFELGASGSGGQPDSVETQGGSGSGGMP